MRLMKLQSALPPAHSLTNVTSAVDFDLLGSVLTATSTRQDSLLSSPGQIPFMQIAATKMMSLTYVHGPFHSTL